jgi:hypothetical protein
LGQKISRHAKASTDYWHNRKGHWSKSFEMNKNNMELIAQVFLKREKNLGKQLGKKKGSLPSKFEISGILEILRLIKLMNLMTKQRQL